MEPQTIFWKHKVVIEFEVDTRGNPKGDVRGNIWCWLGAFEYVVKDAVPGQKLLTHYNKRAKRFGTKPIASKASRSWSGEVPPVQKLLHVFCNHAGIERAESINNMWAGKSFANTTLGDLQLPASTVMSITGHKSEQTMRKYYHQTWHSSNKDMDISRLARAPLLLAKFLDGTLPSIPETVAELYKEIVNQLSKNKSCELLKLRFS